MMKRILQFLNLLLLTLAVYGGVNVFYRFVEIKLHHFELTDMPVKPVAAETVKRSGMLSNAYDVIMERNLFNTVNASAGKPPAPEVDIAALKQTDLNLKLWGTASTEDGKSGTARAVIEAPTSREQHLFRVGDTIAHARIAEILRNSVVLEIQGRKEKLTLEEAMSGLENRLLPDPKIPEAPVTTARTAPGRKIPLHHSQINDAFNNVGQLMQEVKIKPYYQDGKAAGFIVAEIAPESIVRGLGMKDGDIVTSINGRQIKTADDAISFYDSLKAGDQISIQLVRRGRPQTLEFTVEDDMLGAILP